MRKLIVLAALVATFSLPLLSQSAPQSPPAPSAPPPQTFDAISIKPNHSINAGSSLREGIRGFHFGAMNYSLRDVIEFAYDVKSAEIEGLPAWADSEKYDIDAKVDDAVAEQERSLPLDQQRKLAKIRVQALLADRFALQLHHETKLMPVLALTEAKGGPKLSENAAIPAPGDPHPLLPGSMVTRMSGTDSILAANLTPWSNVIIALSGQPEVSGRILVDQTGLNGKYTFTLQWQRQTLSAADASSESSGVSLFSALEEQLGLHLESTKAPVNLLIVDRAQEPTPN